MEKSLSKFSVGEGGRVTRLEGEGTLKKRLAEMGITPGTALQIRRVAPLGDPMELWLRGYKLLLRKKDAQRIFMEPFGQGRGEVK